MGINLYGSCKKGKAAKLIKQEPPGRMCTARADP